MTSRNSRLRWPKAPCQPNVCASVCSSWNATSSLWATAWWRWRGSTRSAGRRPRVHHCLLRTTRGNNKQHELWIEPVSAVYKMYVCNKIYRTGCACLSHECFPHGGLLNTSGVDPCVCLLCLCSSRPASKGVEGLARVGSRAALSFAFAFLRRAWRSGKNAPRHWQWRRQVAPALGWW